MNEYVNGPSTDMVICCKGEVLLLHLHEDRLVTYLMTVSSAENLIKEFQTAVQKAKLHPPSAENELLRDWVTSESGRSYKVQNKSMLQRAKQFLGLTP